MPGKKDKYFNSIFNIKKLLFMCKIYNNDIVDKIINLSFKDININDCVDEIIIDKLISSVHFYINVDIARDIRIMKQIFISKLTLIPIIFGMYSTNKSFVTVDLSYYLSIPNIIQTKTICETIMLGNAIDELSPKISEGDDCKNFKGFMENYMHKCKIISKIVFFEIEKSLKQGKSKIFCGYNLFIPYVFDMKYNGIFPKPDFLNEIKNKDSTLNHYLYYICNENNCKTNALFFPIILNIENFHVNDFNSIFLKKQEYILTKTINNKFGWPVKIVNHDPKNPQHSSKIIHSYILETLKVLYYTGKWTI
ncbi:hypothetical protein FG386_001074 [Cryptosporidium ryanae]|uniref:uncharacterized protein n=1 Tax=Cryptosporidium ryanae TaxID=515981 RepID=UPI00351A9112|nr:hypothetical protein FG386_001074 [Cryptosporidium ryanae]